MNLSFQINSNSIPDFIEHWSSKYFYAQEEKYEKNIGRPLTKETILELFEWKNGSKISTKKEQSIIQNYPLTFNGDYEKRYLNYREPGGAIWNIFYLHCLLPDKWPIYDQHTYRAMQYIKTGDIIEIGTTHKQKYESYQKEYLPFLKELNITDPLSRRVDKALFTFGKFLKIAQKYA